MPSTVDHLLAGARLRVSGVVQWGELVPVGDPGVYLVSLSGESGPCEAALPKAPISQAQVRRWLEDRTELELDAARPTPAQLAERLVQFWLPDEVILYVGLAGGGALKTRVRQYYSTPLGARSPHAGGHWLKALSNLERLFVHYAPAPDPAAAERAMLERFCASVSDETRSALFDRERPLPFASLAWPGRGTKRHGITGSKASRSRTPRRRVAPARATSAATGRTLHAELRRILCASGNAWMTTTELAGAVNAAGRYRKKDGTPMTAFQVHGRTKNYPRLFEHDGSKVRARDCS